jgi:amidohydrolase
MNLWQDAQAIEQEIIDLRRQLHRHPEISHEEHWTHDFIADHLEKLGLTVRRHVAGTGVVAILRGAHDGPVVALRADIDALPVTEDSGVPFASEIPGKMHACGHDIHTTCGLTAAKLLSGVRDQISGTVVFLFQPAEEVGHGANDMLAAGCFDDPKPQMIFGLHNQPEIPVGQVGVKAGPLMAASAKIVLDITGRGGHGAMPHRNIDPIVAGSAIVMALQTIVSRNVNPLEPAVLTIGEFKAGTAFNIIPQTAQLTGTIRSFDNDLYQQMPDMIRRVAENAAASFGATASLSVEASIPAAVVNDERAAGIIEGAIVKALGEGAIVRPTPSMGGEDFAMFQERIPGCFVWLGVGNPEIGATYPWHSPHFKADESAIKIGGYAMAQAAVDALAELAR